MLVKGDRAREAGAAEPRVEGPDRETRAMNHGGTDTVAQRQCATRYVTVVLAGQRYAVELALIQEICGLTGVVPLPHAPAFVRGVVCRRGVDVPIVDLRQRLGLEQEPETPHSCIVFAGVDGLRLGLIVDDVCEAVDVADGSVIEDDGEGEGRECIRGTARMGGREAKILAIDKVLAPEDAAWTADLRGNG
jgi:purine-binding chemotaxis protein CheW